jgi:exosortase A-associated hydrolase 1
MNRQAIMFACAGETLFGTLDMGSASGAVGLLLVSGGNEIRSGAWGGQAGLAARLAHQGVPVFRFDRRGVGDSTGENRGFRASAPDIAAALAAFRAAAPHVKRVVAMGNCDAASALMLGAGLGCDGLVLSNPWTFESTGESEADDGAEEAPPAVLRAHYLRRLRDPAALVRLLSGKVSLCGLVRSLMAMGRKAAPTTLAGEMHRGLAGFDGPVRLLIAGRDRTALAFAGQWDAGDPRLRRCAGASHSFVEGAAQVWLEDQMLEFISSSTF